MPVSYKATKCITNHWCGRKGPRPTVQPLNAKMNKTLLIILSTFLLVACSETRLEVDEFKAVAMGMNSHAWYKGIFYVGTDSTNHHFQEKWDYKFDKKFLLSKSDLKIMGEFQLGTGEVGITQIESRGNDMLFIVDGMPFYSLSQ